MWHWTTEVNSGTGPQRGILAVDHKTPLKSSTNLVFISRFNPIIDSSKVGCCSDEVHVVIGVVILRSGGWGEGGWLLHARMLWT